MPCPRVPGVSRINGLPRDLNAAEAPATPDAPRARSAAVMCDSPRLIFPFSMRE